MDLRCCFANSLALDPPNADHRTLASDDGSRRVTQADPAMGKIVLVFD